MKDGQLMLFHCFLLPGKEGKKVNWQPWNCMKIIMENVGPGENHGCPFR